MEEDKRERAVLSPLSSPDACVSISQARVLVSTSEAAWEFREREGRGWWGVPSLFLASGPGHTTQGLPSQEFHFSCHCPANMSVPHLLNKTFSQFKQDWILVFPMSPTPTFLIILSSSRPCPPPAPLRGLHEGVSNWRKTMSWEGMCLRKDSISPPDLCVCICIYVYIYTHMHQRVCICVCVYTYVCGCVPLQEYIHVYLK